MASPGNLRQVFGAPVTYQGLWYSAWLHLRIPWPPTSRLADFCGSVSSAPSVKSWRDLRETHVFQNISYGFIIKHGAFHGYYDLYWFMMCYYNFHHFPETWIRRTVETFETRVRHVAMWCGRVASVKESYCTLEYLACDCGQNWPSYLTGSEI